MNDATVRELWVRLGKLERWISDVEEELSEIGARQRARLKEEADAARA